MEIGRRRIARPNCAAENCAAEHCAGGGRHLLDALGGVDLPLLLLLRGGRAARPARLLLPTEAHALLLLLAVAVAAVGAVALRLRLRRRLGLDLGGDVLVGHADREVEDQVAPPPLERLQLDVVDVAHERLGRRQPRQRVGALARKRRRRVANVGQRAVARVVVAAAPAALVGEHAVRVELLRALRPAAVVVPAVVVVAAVVGHRGRAGEHVEVEVLVAPAAAALLLLALLLAAAEEAADAHHVAEVLQQAQLVAVVLVAGGVLRGAPALVLLAVAAGGLAV